MVWNSRQARERVEAARSGGIQEITPVVASGASIPDSTDVEDAT